MLNKLFNFGKKSNGYYLELDESKESTNGKVATVTKAVEQKLTSAKEVVEEKAVSAKEIVEEKVASTKEVVEEVVVEAKAKSKTTKNRAKNTQKTPEQTTAKTNTTNSGASSWEQPFWVKAMYQKSASNGRDRNSEATFATDHLMTTGNGSRRRPGPSLNKFKEMASRAKTSS